MEPVKRPTLHLAADAGFGMDNNSSNMTSPTSMAGGFLPDMPQWKKDLIQRRKTNVARTQAAQQAASPTANSSSTTIITTTTTATATTCMTTSISAADTDTITGAGSCLAFLMETTAGAGAGTAAADSIATEASQQQHQQQQSKLLAKRNVSQTQTTTEEKSEKSLIGGHHTQQQPTMMAFSNSAETTATTIPLPIPKQRSSLFNTTTITAAAAATTTTTITTTTRSQSTSNSNNNSKEKEPQILNLDLREQKHEREREERERERERDVVVNSCISSGSGLRGEVETGTAVVATTGALSRDSNGGSGSSSANQLQTSKPGQSVADGEGGGSNTKELLALIDNKNCKTKIISDKLQSNKFIKQQQQQQQQQQQHYHQQQQQLSPTKVTVKTTMVAMQEMKKTTKQNGQHRHHLKSSGNSITSSCSTGEVEKPPPSELDEDLSYGPGIVSKLRCRYLNLALRESHQQNQKQRLQRSTSLNTLLDRDDDEEEVVVVPVTTVAKLTPPPILGSKPVITGYIKGSQALGGQRPVSLGATTSNSSSIITTIKDIPTKTENVGSGAGAGTRSRHFKRGNEVMKRARSVEALLCEKSPWNTYRQATPISPSSPSSTTSTCVTIEDKIHNARERLHSGTDAAPPKRLTSIIDDTERPPPDLVKQTLKMFEAGANRRPRAAHRSNGVGGVASKVATYKSIIKEQKSVSTTTTSSNNSTPAVLGSPTITMGKRDPALLGFASSTPKQQPVPPVGNSNLSHPPDLIPRQMMAANNGAIDSPVSALTKMLGRCQLTEERETEKSDKTSQSSTSPQSQYETNNEHIQDDNENENDAAAADDDGNCADGGGVVDDDDDDNNDNEGENGNIGDGHDNMGAAGDKHKPPTIAIAEGIVGGGSSSGGGGTQRSFAAVNENAHVPSTSSITSSVPRKTIGEPALTSSTTIPTTKQIGVIRPLFNSNSNSSSNSSSIPLTSREIEKNRINEMKKSTALAGDGAAAASLPATTTSLDTVINTNNSTKDTINNASETDAANTNASPIWALRKRRQPQTSNNLGSHHGGATSGDNNTSMVFNFSKSTKEVPDYIESDVVIYRRKRELPKPNEPGFVLLGDLSVETSTDTDYDDYSMCPPSPCDVEFENANIVIDGKSSIRQKAKESSFRVQFNDTLTSTFEYPSEASLTIDDPPYADPFGNVNKYHQLLLAEQMQLLEHQQQQQQQQQQQHHHVTVDEIIELPTSATTTTTSSSSSSSSSSSTSSSSSSVATSNMLGNLPLDYPNLEKGLILQQSQEQQQQQQLPEPQTDVLPAIVANNQQEQEQQQQQQHQLPPPPAPTATSSQSDRIANPICPIPPPLHRRVRRTSVLLKPQYACFLQNDGAAVPPPLKPAPPKPQPRKAASFCATHRQQQQQQQQQQPQYAQSKYKPPTTTTTTTISTSTATARSRNRMNSSSSSNNNNNNNNNKSSSSCNNYSTATTTTTTTTNNNNNNNNNRRRPSLPAMRSSTSLALPNASTALLQARIPGTTLYYV